MLNSPFLENGGFIWPSHTSMTAQSNQRTFFLRVLYQGSSGGVRHRAFAVGFFGFHYIRATIENSPSLRKDSLRRLKGLLADLHVDGRCVSNLNLSTKQSYADFKEMTIRQISLELGDSFNSAVQSMVEFGFHLASVHSLLVAASECRTSSMLKSNLKYFVSQFPSLLRLAKKSEISETLLDPLVESLDVIKCRKTKGTVCKCCELTGLVLTRLLVTSTAVKLLD